MAEKWSFTGKGNPTYTTQVDVRAASTGTPYSADPIGAGSDVASLLRQLVVGQTKLLHVQNRQNELLEEVVEQLSSAGRQRNMELAQWKQANPYLARSCKAASEKLGRIQTDFIDSLSDEIEENFELLQDGDFVLNEFVDRFGPRFVHLNTILQVLTQLGNAPDLVVTQKTT